jgi:NAD(P)-dependent dehydrogenase (short-subunit alcohol dehydrogenase family)
VRRGSARPCASGFAAEGARVAVLDRDGEGGRRVAAAVGGVAYEADVRDADAVSAAVDAAGGELGGLSVLVADAGVSGLSLTHETDPARFERIVQVNLSGTFHALRAAIPHMLAGGRGSIVCNASGSAARPTYGELA